MLLNPNTYSTEYDGEIKKYKKEIKSKSKDLEEIKQELGKKKTEKEKLKKEESAIRKEVIRIERELSKLSAEIVKLESEIRFTEKKLRAEEKRIQVAKLQIKSWQSILAKELDKLYRNHYALSYTFTDPWIEKLRLSALKVKTDNINSAKILKSTAEKSHQKYLLLQSELSNLRQSLTEKKAQQQAVYRDKEKLYKSAHGRRIAAEEDIKSLEQTAEELKDFIQKLEAKKKEAIEKRYIEELERKEFAKKIHNLPWPVTGEITTNFGKNKHPELDTYIISNGIKIKTSGSQQVLSVDSGEVVYAQDFRSYGKTVIIDHGGGVYSVYGQLEEILVDSGTKLNSQTVVGKTGTLNNWTLYFEIRINGQPQDPTVWLK